MRLFVTTPEGTDPQDFLTSWDEGGDSVDLHDLRDEDGRVVYKTMLLRLEAVQIVAYTPEGQLEVFTSGGLILVLL